MEAGILVTLLGRHALILSLSLCCLVLAPPPIYAQETGHKHQDLRLYRVNKDGIASRFWFTRGKAKKPGCHNIRKKSRLHRAVQFGYDTCRIYTKKDCADDTAVKFTRDDDPQPTTELLQGYSWFTVSEHPRGVRIKSWICDVLKN